jgi:hypothetical protein
MRPLSQALLRALGSTVVICFVALGVSAFRLHRLSFTGLFSLAGKHWQIGFLVFLGAAVWEIWFRRAAKLETTYQDSRASQNTAKRDEKL